MKKVLILASILTLGVSAHAQQRQRQERPGPPTEEMINKAKEDLGLSDEQFEQWKEIHAAFAEERKGQEKGKSEEGKQMREEFEEKIAAILTEEQLEKFKAHQKNRPDKKGGGRRG